MNLILDECKYAEDILDKKIVCTDPYKVLLYIAKYYKSIGLNKTKTRKKIDAFIIGCNPNASMSRWNDSIERAIKYAWKYKPVRMDGIHISEQELQTIGSIRSAQTQRLAFTLLCVAKYCDAVSGSDKHWANMDDSEIARLACITTAVRAQSAMYRDLMERGLIEFSQKIDNLNVRVLFVSDGPDAMVVTDTRNLGYQYMMHCGDKNCFVCENCGAVVRAPAGGKGRPRKYCKMCYEDVDRKKSLERMRAIREPRVDTT